MWTESVNRGTTVRNLFWCAVAVVVVTFHGCMALQWMEAQDEQDRTGQSQSGSELGNR